MVNHIGTLEFSRALSQTQITSDNSITISVNFVLYLLHTHVPYTNMKEASSGYLEVKEAIKSAWVSGGAQSKQWEGRLYLEAKDSKIIYCDDPFQTAPCSIPAFLLSQVPLAKH